MMNCEAKRLAGRMVCRGAYGDTSTAGCDAVERLPSLPGSAQGAAPTVLIPGRHEEPYQGDWDQPKDYATEEGFDH